MNELAPAVFRLENFRFTEFAFKLPPNIDGVGLAVRLSPSGVHFKKERRFVLLLEFEAFAEQGVKEAGEGPASPDLGIETEKPVLTTSMQAAFIVETENGELPEYFHGNIIGIAFPFLRSFINTLTLQANTTQLVLPIANLTYLIKPLRDNTQVIEQDISDSQSL